MAGSYSAMSTTATTKLPIISKRVAIESIELSFQVLREQFPKLSLILQNQLCVIRNNPELIDEGETIMTLTITETASIIEAISAIGVSIAEDQKASKEQGRSPT